MHKFRIQNIKSLFTIWHQVRPAPFINLSQWRLFISTRTMKLLFPNTQQWAQALFVPHLWHPVCVSSGSEITSIRPRTWTAATLQWLHPHHYGYAGLIVHLVYICVSESYPRHFLKQAQLNKSWETLAQDQSTTQWFGLRPQNEVREGRKQSFFYVWKHTFWNNEDLWR